MQQITQPRWINSRISSKRSRIFCIKFDDLKSNQIIPYDLHMTLHTFLTLQYFASHPAKLTVKFKQIMNILMIISQKKQKSSMSRYACKNGHIICKDAEWNKNLVIWHVYYVWSEDYSSSLNGFLAWSNNLPYSAR